MLKGDRASAYKKLPLCPTYANLTVIVLRNPKSGKRMGFAPKVLLFGPVSAVLRYNFFSRALEVLSNKCLGIPLCSYYGDFGPLTPSSSQDVALMEFSSFSAILRGDLNKDKSQCKPGITFLGLMGVAPCLSGKILLKIYLHPKKIELWSGIVINVISDGKIGHKALETLIRKLSFHKPQFSGDLVAHYLIHYISNYILTPTSNTSHPLNTIPFGGGRRP